MRPAAFLALILGLAALWPLGAAAEGHAVPGAARIEVTGRGTVSAEPDLARVRAGVTSEAETAQAALRATSLTMQQVFAALAELEIAPEDIRTAEISLSPRWGRPAAPGGEAGITGYVAGNTVVVTVRSLDRLGVVLDRMGDAGVNAINGVSFDLSDPRAQQDEARRRAVADAAAKAALYAEAAGVGLGPLLRLAEPGAGRPAPMPQARFEMAEASAAMPVAPGALSLTAEVVAVYAAE